MIQLQETDRLNIVRCKSCKSIFSLTNQEFKDHCNSEGSICPNCSQKMTQQISFVCRNDYDLTPDFRGELLKEELK